ENWLVLPSSDLRRFVISRSGGKSRAAAEIMNKIIAIGLCKNASQPPPMSVRRKFDSASGPRINPSTVGPAGKPKRSMNKPMSPMMSMMATSKTELLTESVPTKHSSTIMINKKALHSTNNLTMEFIRISDSANDSTVAIAKIVTSEYTTYGLEPNNSGPG